MSPLLFMLTLAQSEPASQPSSQPFAQEDPSTHDAVDLEPVTVMSTSLGQARVAGSAHQIDQKRLETFSYTDVERALAEVPGVYVRGEDGFGLRPNIGMRGASSDRSAKVTLMEDGVLFAPGPYSSPEAYYFPLMSRVASVEVYKGPASIKYGPNTVGGALNLLTRPVPRKLALTLDVSGGMYGTAKANGSLGYGNERFGVLLEGGLVRSDGFKTLPTRQSTGFSRTEWMLKASYNTPIERAIVHQLDLKAVYSGELSNESYTGISDADFARDPYQRYAATADDVMRASRTLIQLGYSLTANEMWELSVKAYRQDLHRAWHKLNGVDGAGPLEDIFRSGTAGQPVVEQLRGSVDTPANQALLIGSNDRLFLSEGVQTTLVVHPVLGPVRQDIELGLRLHYDQVIRVHDEGPYALISGRLVPQGPIGLSADNTGSALAFSGYVQDQVSVWRLLVTPGIRVEAVGTSLVDRRSNLRADNGTVAVLPGVGASLHITDWLSALAGVHRGFSPKAPGQANASLPELSVNSEGGLRAAWRNRRNKLDAEAIAFLNDYQNLTAQCEFSASCVSDTTNQQFSAGGVLVYGVEGAASYRHDFDRGFELHAQGAYTFTLSEFEASFLSGNPMWGVVTKGDRLPYVPEHQGSLGVGFSHKYGGLDLNARAQSAMRDLPGLGPIPANLAIPAYAYLDVAAYVMLPANIRVYVNADNVTNTKYMIGRRPFGARPGKPLTVMAGLRYQF